jgi:predicted AlkP superfamily phosphohydrolase/phosphomutase
MGYRIELDEWYHPGKEQETLDAILAVMRVQEQANHKLLRESDWDLYQLVFRSTDLAQHYFWRFMDPGHPDYTKEEGRQFGDLIPRVYEECDAAIARLIETAGPDANVFVVSDHGFGRETKMVHLSNWLHRLDYMRFNKSPLGRLKKLTFDFGLTADNVMNTLGRFGLEKIFTRASRETKSKIFSSFFLSYADVDWSRTRAYARGQIGQIFLNVRGREPQGIVDPGEEYYELRAEIVEKLLEMKDPDTNEHMVDAVHLKEEVFSGKYAEDAPDITIDWRDMEYWAFDVLAGGRKIVAPNLRTRSGGHRMNGIFLASGPDIAKGRALNNPRIVDIAPTLLHVLGLPVPSHMDGRVLTEAFADGSRPANVPITYEQTNGAHKGETVGYTPEQEEKVKERLRQLGYLS